MTVHCKLHIISDNFALLLYFITWRCIYVAEGEWKLIVKTSDLDNAGTSARVFVTFYGVKSHSEKLQLVNEDSNPFQRGKASTFTVILHLRPRFALSLFNIQVYTCTFGSITMLMPNQELLHVFSLHFMECNLTRKNIS